MTEYNSKSYAIKTFIAGGIAGCAAKTAIAPMDRFKILLQVHHSQYKSYNIWRGLGAVVRHEGYRGLYKGNGAMMVRVFPYAAIQFVAYEQYKKLTKPYFSSKTQTNKILSGSLAGVTAVLCTYPLDLVRAKLAFQVDHKHYKGITHTLVTIVRNEGGVLSLYRGIVPTLLQILPYAGLAFYTYEVCKSYVLRNMKFCTKPSLDQSGTVVLTVPANLICGGIGGAVAQTFGYPFDVARRNMQLSKAQDQHRRNLRATLRDIFRQHGITGGIYRGLSINFYRAIPQVAVSFTVYDLMKQLLNISKPL
ncbi:solute carrier family 25 member 16-like [Dysidea avara]|uniref:solute carrier family 25 member 16-like n=1 Tax=Dysidea avara TaxID=196820 RepID=UPI003331C2A6